jgi:hypothetical protein
MWVCGAWVVESRAKAFIKYLLDNPISAPTFIGHPDQNFSGRISFAIIGAWVPVIGECWMRASMNRVLALIHDLLVYCLRT